MSERTCYACGYVGTDWVRFDSTAWVGCPGCGDMIYLKGIDEEPEREIRKADDVKADDVKADETREDQGA